MRYLLLITLITTSVIASAEEMRIAAGARYGVYYNLAHNICKQANKPGKDHCIYYSTAGSLDNINLLSKGEVDFAIVQADVAQNAYLENELNRPSFQDLRLVTSLGNEYLTIIVPQSSSISAIEDLRGKNIYLGSPGSGAWLAFREFMNARRLKEQDYNLLSDLKGQVLSALCDSQQIDAYVIMASHPNGAIRDLVSKCEVRFLNIDQASINKVVAANNVYKAGVIAKNIYPGIDEDINSFSSKAVIVTKSNVPRALVDKLLNVMVENFAQIKQNNNMIYNLELTDLFDHNIAIAVHENVSYKMQQLKQ